MNDAVVNPVATNEGNPKIIDLTSNLFVPNLVIATRKSNLPAKASDIFCFYCYGSCYTESVG